MQHYQDPDKVLQESEAKVESLTREVVNLSHRNAKLVEALTEAELHIGKTLDAKTAAKLSQFYKTAMSY
jgi:hypothetical protein